MKKRPNPRFHLSRYVCALMVVCTLLLSCGLTAFAAEEGSPDLVQPTVTAIPTPTTTPIPLPPYPEDMKDELFPSDVETIVQDGTRQIIKTYILTPEQSPYEIPRDGFERDGWHYSLTDITEKRTSGMDRRSHTEIFELSTDTKDLNEIIKLLSPTLEYQSEDGYCGLLALDIATVKCEAAGYKNSSYTVTATREYPHLSTNDLSLIPKTITENGRSLQLDDVSWEVQHTVNVDYDEIPDSYRAVATYTAAASKSVVTGYITTAEYVGEITKAVTGDTIYAAYFWGSKIIPTLAPTEKPTSTPEPTDTPVTEAPTKQEPVDFPVVPLLVFLAVIAALGGATAFFFLRRNVKIYRDSFAVLVAKDKVSEKSMAVNLTPLGKSSDDRCFGIEIDSFTAKSLNGKTIDVIYGPASLKHQIAYEGNTYRIEADFREMTIKAIY